MTRTRKLHKAKGKGLQRKSQRICALESKDAPAAAPSNSKRPYLLDNDNTQGQGPAFRTRGQKKRKLKPVRELTASSPSPLSQPNKGVKHSRNEPIQKKSDRQSEVPSSTFVPEKRILELVLDTLQRRDSYEIFAEPVDPNEVEDYYEIIEEPMDFGTMRAKLHEGMYKSLDQFEARAINELAIKVFDLLKTNPDKFELEFSETRRKVGRRNQGDFTIRDLTDSKSSEIISDLPSKMVPSSSRGGPSNRKSFKANHACSEASKHLEVPTGTKDSSRYRSSEFDRRCTYKPLSLGEDESMFSPVYDKLNLLERVNQNDIGYKDSLMLFVKDLGPTAQNIAKRKLLGCEIRTASTSSAPLRPPNTPNEMRNPKGRETSYTNDETDNAKVEGILKNAYRDKKVSSSFESNSQGTHRWFLGCDTVFANQSLCSDSYYSRACAQDSKETGNKSMMMHLDKSKLVDQEKQYENNSQTDVLLGSRMEHKSKFQSNPWSLETRHEIRFSSEAMKSSNSEQTLPPASGFVFNLPYLRTRLDQMKSSEQYRFFQQDFSANKRPFSAPQVSYHQGVLTRNPPIDLRNNTLCSHYQQQQ